MLLIPRNYTTSLAIFLMLFANTVTAGEIYQYSDENGIKRFSDTPPRTEKKVRIFEAIAPKQKKKLHIVKTHRNGNRWLTIVNPYHCPAEVEMSFKSIANLISSPPLPQRFVVPANSKLDAVKLTVIQRNKPSPYRYHYRYILGARNVKHAPTTNYRLPFLKGYAFRVSQGFNGAYSHNSDRSRYAVDFKMPVGTPIVCARNGTVVAVEQEFVWGGNDRDYYGKKGNGIRILHEDGTMAFYGHLKRGSAVVECGDKVAAGQRIADSGNTGFSRGPHLHFVIQKNVDMRWHSVPFVFNGPNSEKITPVKGQTLRAP